VWSAHLHPHVFGNVLAQSDARFPLPSGLDVYELVAREIANAPPRETRFHLEEGHVLPLAIEDCGASLTMRVLRAAMIDADEGALATFREALDAGREVDANTLAKLGFALLYALAAPRAAIAVFSACATRFPSLAAQANVGEAQLVLGDRLA
jgi:hypothetical protein